MFYERITGYQLCETKRNGNALPQIDPAVIHSRHSQHVLVDGHRFEIKIFCTDQDPDWCLGIIDARGTVHAWESAFEDDDEALEAALLAFEEEGAEGFLNPDVIPFPGRRN